MDSVDLTYQVPVGSQGAKVGAEYFRSHYLLGKEFADLGAGGEAITTSCFGTYPFVRSRNLNINGRIGFKYTKLQDRQDATDTVSDKQISAWSIGVNGNVRDKKGDGITVFALNYSIGNPQYLYAGTLVHRSTQCPISRSLWNHHVQSFAREAMSDTKTLDAVTLAQGRFEARSAQNDWKVCSMCDGPA